MAKNRRLDPIIVRLRTLADKFSGVALSHRLPPGDHGASRDLLISFLDADGAPKDVADELLDLADEVSLLGEPDGD